MEEGRGGRPAAYRYTELTRAFPSQAEINVLKENFKKIISHLRLKDTSERILGSTRKKPDA